MYLVATEDTCSVCIVANGPNIVNGMQLHLGGGMPSFLALLVQDDTPS